MMNFPSGTLFTPYSVVRNITNQPTIVTPTIWWMADGVAQSAQGQQITIAPHKTMKLNVPALLATAGLKNFNGSFNLVLDTKAETGALVLAGGSVDQKNTYVFEVMPHGIGESASKALCHWSTGNGDDTMVTLWNPADEEQNLVFTLFFSRGHYAYPIQLGPRATRSFNVSEILHSSIPDAEGNVIPAGISEGSGEISGSRGENEHILVSVDTSTYNVRKAICGYNCVVCNGVVGTSVVVNPVNVSVNGYAQEYFYEDWNTGSQVDMTNFSVWNIGPTSVAIFTGNNGRLEGLSPGSFGFSATDDYSEPTYLASFCSPGYSCPNWPQPPSGSGGGTVYDSTPVITGIDPSDWTAGSPPIQVTFNGQYFGTNKPTLGFSPSAGIGATLTSYNDTQIIANVTVAAGTPNEDVSVTVTNNGYGGNSFNGGSVGQSATSSSSNVRVQSPNGTPEVTVIAWIDKSQIIIPGGENTALFNALYGTPDECAIQIGYWWAGVKNNINNSYDAAFANAWLLYMSYNPAPPSVITPSVQYSQGNYRFFNDWGAGRGIVQVGATPEPCGLGELIGWAPAGQPFPTYNGATGKTSSNNIYQLAEARVGTAGQKVSQTINGGRTVPWFWSVIEFNSSNQSVNLISFPPASGNFQIFPTYSVYVNGFLAGTSKQSTPQAITLLNGSSQLLPSQIQ
jgi:hypothetical protein